MLFEVLLERKSMIRIEIYILKRTPTISFSQPGEKPLYLVFEDKQCYNKLC